MSQEASVEDSDKMVDRTEDWEVYRHGKTLSCVCGLGIGTFHHTRNYKCPVCGVINHDSKANSREWKPENKDGNATLDQFI